MLASAQNVVLFVQIAFPVKRRRLRHNVNDLNATTVYVTMMRTELISAPEYWIGLQCVFQRFFCYLASLFYSVCHDIEGYVST